VCSFWPRTACATAAARCYRYRCPCGHLRVAPIRARRAAARRLSSGRRASLEGRAGPSAKWPERSRPTRGRGCPTLALASNRSGPLAAALRHMEFAERPFAAPAAGRRRVASLRLALRLAPLAVGPAKGRLELAVALLHGRHVVEAVA
nr:hypothetical protein [Tanacetum cinerariifolium]